MLQHVTDHLATLEARLSDTSRRADVLAALRPLGLGDFGAVMFAMPLDAFPRLSSLLPRMASVTVQESWTGCSGDTLLVQSVDFMRALSCAYTQHTGKTLEGKRILDFGCGYGRLARLSYYFTDERQYTGVDPWARSIELCHEAGLEIQFHQSDYLPALLPVEQGYFDLAFAFSVFTHLSARATRTCLRALARCTTQDGLIAITIRPVEYWDIDAQATATGAVEAQKQAHAQHGFAFLPHKRDAVDGDVTYGDTSLTLEWLERECPELEVVGIDRSIADPYQLYVFLRHRNR